MALNNNDDDPRNTGRRQNKTEVVEHVEQDSANDLLLVPLSLSTPVVVVVVPPALSFGTILEEFPDFLSCVLLYIADRVIWNSIASSNKDMHEKSKAILPPWPIYYKLPLDGDWWAWSSCGTRIACSVHGTNIAIVDQRRGPLRRWQHIPDGYFPVTDLKFSPDGSFLISSSAGGIVRLWDNTTGSYEQLQEWNTGEELYIEEMYGHNSKVSVSACSKYIAVSMGNRVLLKDVSGGKITKSFMPPFIDRHEIIGNLRFSSNGRAVYICFLGKLGIKVWCPYLDDDDEDSLTTLFSRQTNLYGRFRTYTFSDNNSMISIKDSGREVTLCSIDTEHKFLAKKLDFSTSLSLRDVYFTPDGKYIFFNGKTRSRLWNIAEGKFTNNKMHFLGSGSKTKHNLAVEIFSPNNRQCIVQESDNYYITSYIVK